MAACSAGWTPKWFPVVDTRRRHLQSVQLPFRCCPSQYNHLLWTCCPSEKLAPTTDWSDPDTGSAHPFEPVPVADDACGDFSCSPGEIVASCQNRCSSRRTDRHRRQRPTQGYDYRTRSGLSLWIERLNWDWGRDDCKDEKKDDDQDDSTNDLNEWFDTCKRLFSIDKAPPTSLNTNCWLWLWTVNGGWRHQCLDEWFWV